MDNYVNQLYTTEYEAYGRWLRLKRYSNLSTYKNYMGIIRRFLNQLDCCLTDVTQAGIEHYLLQFNSPSIQYVAGFSIFAFVLVFKKRMINI